MKKYFTVGFFSLSQSLLQILGLIILTRLLEPSAVGFYAIAALISSVSRLGLSGVLPAILKASEDESHYMAGITLCLARIASSILFALGCIYFLLAGAKIDEFFYCYLYAFAIFTIQAISLPYEALLIRKKKQAYLVRYEFTNYLMISFPASVGLALMSLGMHALLAPQLLGVLLRYFALRKRFGGALSARYDLYRLKPMLSLNFASVLNYFSTQGDRFYISMYYPLDFLGVYTRGSQIFQFSAAIYSKIVGYVNFPEFSSEKRVAKRSELFLRSFELSYIVSMWLGLLCWLPTEVLLRYLLGEQWASSAEIAGTFVVFMAPRLTYKLSDYFVMAVCAGRTVVLFQMLYAMLTLMVLFFLTVVPAGHEHIALAMCVSVSIYFVIVTFYSLSMAEASYKKYIFSLYGVSVSSAVYITEGYLGKLDAYFLGWVLFIPCLLPFRNVLHEKVKKFF